ncbi:MAG: aspartate aminotransferase family protein [Proteobacteria bacterium]|nr:aspartate aminotransferase family protein [Pseudomonadota bacterium]
MSYPDMQSRSAQLFERGRKVIPGGNTRKSVYFAPYPTYAASVDGCRVTDVDGVERLDFVNNNSATVLGHNHPAIVDAVVAQAKRMMAAGMPTELEIELAEMICERVASVDQVRFANSGTEAVMFAVRAARAYTGRNVIAKVEGAYHGSWDPMYTSMTPLPDTWGEDSAPTTTLSSAGIPQGAIDDILILPANDVKAARELLRANADDLAGVLIDPLVSQMGFLALTNEYLAMIRQVCSDLGAQLIFDEVFSFRLGYHGAQEEFGVQADITAFGKLIGGGLPVGAIGGGKDIMAVFDHTAGGSVPQSGTFSGSCMTMAAGIAALKEMTPQRFEQINALGEYAREGMRSALQEAGLTGVVNGRGSLMSVLLVESPFDNYRELFNQLIAGGAFALGAQLHQYLLNHGIACIPPGVFILSAAMTEADIDELLRVATDAFREIAQSE